MLVQASGLVKQYPRVRALDQVSLEIKEGEVFGLFGPNGAGKTTCLRVLSGLTQPDAGSATVCGIDVRAAPNEVRRELGILIDIPFPYEEVTVRRYLSFFAEMAGVPAYDIPMKVEWALTLLGITRGLKSTLLAPAYELEVGDVDRGLAALRAIPHQSLERAGRGLVRIGLVSRDDAPRIARTLVEANVDLLEMRSLGTMEDV